MTSAVWITPSYPWSGDPSSGVFYRTQAQALERHGIAVSVVTPTPWAPWPLRLLRDRWATLAASPTRADDGPISISRPRYLNAPGEPAWARPDRRIAAAAFRVRSAWSTAQLVHGHYAITGIAAWRVATRAGLPLVLTFHGSDINTWPALHSDRVEDLRSAIREAAAVIAVSQALADRVSDLAGVEVTHLPLGSPGAALQAQVASSDATRRAPHAATDRTVALFVGHLKASKGVREFVDGVLAAGPSFQGILVGDGPERGYGLDHSGGGDRITYVGAVPHEEVPRYLAAADVLVLPSRSEGLPTVVVEAGFLEVPVIASAVGGVPELLSGDRGTMLSDISGPAVAAALRDLRDQPGAAARRAERLALLVRESYDSDRNAARLADIYRAVIDARG